MMVEIFLLSAKELGFPNSALYRKRVYMLTHQVGYFRKNVPSGGARSSNHPLPDQKYRIVVFREAVLALGSDRFPDA